MYEFKKLYEFKNYMSLMRNSGSAIHTLCVVLCSFWISRKMEELIVDDIPIFPRNPKTLLVM